MPERTSINKANTDVTAEGLETGFEALDSVFREIILQSPISTWVANKEGTLIFENAANRAMFGIDSDDQVVGKYNLFADQVLQEQGLIPAIKRVFDEGIPFEGTFDYDFSRAGHVNVPGATHKYLRVFIFPIKSQEDDCVHYAVIQHEDYTDRLAAEEQLKASEERFHALSDAAFEGIVIHNQGVGLEINEAFTRATGYNRSDVIGKRRVDIFTPESANEVMKHILSGSEEPYEVTIRRKDGSVFTAEIQGRSMVYKDQPARVTALRDITARKKAEEELCLFKQAVDTSVDGILVVKSNGTIAYINPACAAMHGYAQEELEGKPGSILMQSPKEAARILKETLETGRWVGETIQARRDLTTFIMEARLSVIDLPGSNSPGILAICRDVTAEKQAEESKRRMEEYFKEQQRQFYKQTIMAATGGKLMILEPEEISTIPGTLLETLEIKKPVDIGIVRRSVDEYAREFNMSETRIENLALCVGEAATNALKHAGGGVVDLLRDDNRLLIRISDHGPGMDALILPRATLELGYSTGHSLGMGYAVILSLSDQVSLCTGPGGTSVVIEMDITNKAEQVKIHSFPEIW